uniref:acyl-ACP thioesterase n=1 Tax=Pararhizobium sp. IMCC3301 TaxID=3067904 RepID=UPI002741F926|nr:acyl-ACP thioesterase [Pararhizobium sp. IMCC3301]
MNEVTLRSTVNTWQCDENAHMNVQFYFAKFDDADRVFRDRFALPSLSRAMRLTRHVRYHREAAAAAMIEVRSAIVQRDGKPAAVRHQMTSEPGHAVIATALDTYQPDALAQISARLQVPTVDWDDISNALPRGLDIAPSGEDSDTSTRSGIATYHGVLHPRDFAADGHLLDRAVISCFTDAAPHAWAAGGIEPAWLQQNKFGRVAVEMKLTYGAVPKPGAIVSLETAFLAVGNTTFTLRHTLTSSGRIVAYGELVSLMMDLDLRKAVPLPERADQMRQLAATRFSQ